jgi:hypothetical protein
MTAIPSRRHNRTVAAFLCGLLGMVLLPSGLALAANSLLHSTDGDSVDTKNIIKIPSTPAALLAVVDGNGFVASLQMIALAPGGRGGTIVSIPVGAASVVTSSEAPRRLGDAFLLNGLDGLTTDVEGLLNVTFTAKAAVTEVEMAAMLGGDRAVNVEIDRAVNTLLPTGIQEILPAGKHTLTSAQVAGILASNQAGAPESDRLPIIKSLWVGVAGAGLNTATTTSEVVGTATTLVPALTVQEFLQRTLTGEVQVWQFAANAIPQGDLNPTNSDMYALDKAEVIMVVASVAPSSVSSLYAAINVQIDSAFTDATITREAVLRLSMLGVNVVLVREVPGEPAVETVVQYNDDPVRAEVESYSSIFGPLAPKQVTQQVEGVDARIVLGTNFRDFIAGQPSGGGITTSTSIAVDESEQTS